LSPAPAGRSRFEEALARFRDTSDLKVDADPGHRPPRAAGRNVERLANSALMLNPDFHELQARHLATVGGRFESS
jgi:hypothetical protein